MKNEAKNKDAISLKQTGEGAKRLRAFREEKERELGIPLNWQQVVTLALAWWTPKKS